MSTDTKVVQVPAYIDITDPVADEATVWLAQATAGSPFASLYAVGESFAEARQSLAELVWLAIRHGAVEAGVTADEVGSVRVFALTRKTFPVASLEQAS